MSIKIVSITVFRKKNSRIEFLLLHRLKSVGGFWQSPGGKREKTDVSLKAAALREVYEETGISKKDVIKYIPTYHKSSFDKHYLTNKPIRTIYEDIVGLEVKPDVKITLEVNIIPEHDSFVWVSFKKALTMLKWQNNKDAFHKFHHILLEKN